MYKSLQDILLLMKMQYKINKNRLCIKGLVYKINNMLWCSSKVRLITLIIPFKIFQSQATVRSITSRKHTVLLFTLIVLVIISIIEIKQLIMRNCNYYQTILKMVIILETIVRMREYINSLKYKARINI